MREKERRTEVDVEVDVKYIMENEMKVCVSKEKKRETRRHDEVERNKMIGNCLVNKTVETRQRKPFISIKKIEKKKGKKIEDT